MKRLSGTGYRDGSRTCLPAFPGGGEDLVETIVGLPAQVHADGQRVTDELGRIAGAALEDLDGEVLADDAAQAINDLLDGGAQAGTDVVSVVVGLAAFGEDVEGGDVGLS